MKISIHFEIRVNIVKDVEHADKSVSCAETKQALSVDFYEKMENEIEKLSHLRSLSTIENYRMALRSFREFQNSHPDDKELDHALLKQYELWLRQRHVSLNTCSCYMRSLRSLATKIYGDDAKSWFKEVYTGCDTTDKRAIDESDIAKLRGLKLKQKSFMSMVRDLFLFSFYALGMPFVDLAFLRKSQIADGKITYYRQKTGQRITIPIEPCMQDIINRYQSDNRDYVFPLLKSGDTLQCQKAYRTMLNRYNHTLKVLGERAGVSRRLTSYVARHTWASIAYQSNVDLSVISKALGHTNPQHTPVYIQQINDNRVNEAVRKILTKIL